MPKGQINQTKHNLEKRKEESIQAPEEQEQLHAALGISAPAQVSHFELGDEAIIPMAIPADIFGESYDFKRVNDYINGLYGEIDSEIADLKKMKEILEIQPDTGKEDWKKEYDTTYKKLEARKRNFSFMWGEVILTERMVEKAQESETVRARIERMRGGLGACKRRMEESDAIMESAEKKMEDICFQKQEEIGLRLEMLIQTAENMIKAKSDAEAVGSVYGIYLSEKENSGLKIGERAKTKAAENRVKAEELKSKVDEYMESHGKPEKTSKEKKEQSKRYTRELRRLFDREKNWVPLLIKIQMIEKGNYKLGFLGTIQEWARKTGKNLNQYIDLDMVNAGKQVKSVYDGAKAGKDAFRENMKGASENEMLGELKDEMIQSKLGEFLVGGSKKDDGKSSIKEKVMSIVNPVIAVGKFLYEMYQFFKEKNRMSPEEKKQKAINLWVEKGGNSLVEGCKTTAVWIKNVPWLGAVAGIIGAIVEFAQGIVKMIQATEIGKSIRGSRRKLNAKLEKMKTKHGMTSALGKEEKMRLMQKHRAVAQNPQYMEEKIAAMRKKKRYMSLEDRITYREIKKLDYMQRLEAMNEAKEKNDGTQLDTVVSMTTAAVSLVGNIAKLCPGIGSLIGLTTDVSNALIKGGKKAWESGKQFFIDMFASDRDDSTVNIQKRREGFARKRYGELAYVASKLKFGINEQDTPLTQDEIEAAVSARGNAGTRFSIPDSASTVKQVAKTTESLSDSFKSVGMYVTDLKKANSREDMLLKIANGYY